MKKPTVYLILLYSLGFVFQAWSQSNNDLKKLFREHYSKFVEPGNTFIDAGPNYMVERTPDRHFLKKTFYFETGRQTTKISFADSLLTMLDGISVEWYDDGRFWSEGNFAKGEKIGLWKEEGMEYGMPMAYGVYANGKKEGRWIAFDSLKNTCEAHYKDGKITGTPQFLNADGTPDTVRLARFIRKIYADADFMNVPPSFPCRKKYADAGKKCGERSLLDYLGTNIEYPPRAREIGIEGTAILEFVVDKDGSVTDIVALRGICDDIKKECIRVVKKMPKWNPGVIDDHPVRVRYKLPVRFRLE